MATTKFTDYMLKSLKPGEKKYYKREAHGFAICVYPSGIKSFFFIYTINGKRHSMALGNYPDMPLTKAREAYNSAWKLFSEGHDPAQLADAAVTAKRQAPTVAALVAEYLERYAKVFKRSWQEDERILCKEVLPLWGNLKVEDIKKRDIILLLESIVDRGTPGMANNTFKIIRKMFNYAIEKDIIPYSPAYGVKLPAPTVAKERALSAAEIKTFWNALESSAMDLTTRQALKLVLVTAQRPGEVSGMHTDEIDGRWWTIPTERSKNGKAHRVYLTDLALSIIGDISGKKYVFPSPIQKNEKSIERHALSRALRRNSSKDSSTTLSIQTFTPHDLRRTAATFMAQQGVMDEVIDAVLNHSKQGIIKVYNLYRYEKEKQQALEAWEKILTSILA